MFVRACLKATLWFKCDLLYGVVWCVLLLFDDCGGLCSRVCVFVCGLLCDVVWRVVCAVLCVLLFFCVWCVWSSVRWCMACWC